MMKGKLLELMNIKNWLNTKILNKFLYTKGKYI